MRYDKGRREATRERILEVATTNFKTHGLEGSGIKTIMSDAGLTNGAFYSHFVSKDALIRESMEQAMESQQGELLGLAERSGLEGVLRTYLSTVHRDDAGSGCPSAALLPEVARHPEEIRDSYTRHFRSFVDCIAEYLPGENMAKKASTARALFGLALGSLQLARAVSDEKLSREILDGAVQAGLHLSAELSATDT